MRTPSLKSQQHGAALMVMLVIMVVGIAAVLVGSFNSSALNITRQQQTSAALAQAKEALIGRAAADVNLPGSLPCPDAITNIVSASGVPFNIPNDGIADLLVGNDCPSYIGHLPWKTLGLPDLRDGQGERLWYALSKHFHDDNSNHINSDSVGTLNITGTQTSNNAAAILFSAGNALAGDSRADTQNAICTSLAGTSLAASAVPQSDCASNYLENNNALASTATAPNTLYQAGKPGDNLINDQLLPITQAQLMQVIETRIAREVKSCLDNYALAMGNKYPWAVPAQNWYLSGEANTQFGRIPYQKPINDNKIQDFLDALANLQTKVNACIAQDNNSNANALDNAGNTLENAAKTLANAQTTTPALSSAVTIPAKQAGDRAQNNNMCDIINGNPNNNIVQTNLNATLAALTTELAGEIATGNSDKAVRCDALFQKHYWQDWKNLVFYQVDDIYRPTGGGNAPGAIQINNTGSYRAAVLIARTLINPQQRTPLQTTPTGYLEGGNAHNANNPANNFTAYRPSEAGFSGVNDLVLCMDGGVNCK